MAQQEQVCVNRCPWCKSDSVIVKNDIFRCPRCGYEADISGPHEIRVIGWTTHNDDNFFDFPCTTSEIREAIVKEIRDKGYFFDCWEHQSDVLPCTPVINNGCRICCSVRAWSHIMAQAHGEEEPKGKIYQKVFFADIKDPIYPVKGVDLEMIVPFEIKDE